MEFIYENQKRKSVKNLGPLLFLLSFLVSFFAMCFLENTAEAKSKKQTRQRQLIEIEHQVEDIEKMIALMGSKVPMNKRKALAKSIYVHSKKYQIDPKIVVAIIDTESNFRSTVVSSTGDISLAQINHKVWNREFKRLKKSRLNIKRLKKDDDYAIMKMAEILTILKNRYAKHDPYWYASYHSRTKKYKYLYKKKVNKRIQTILAAL